MQHGMTPTKTRASVQRLATSATSDGEVDALELYFRELERESLMKPDEELEAASRILSLRQRYWAEMLSYVPLHGGVEELILASMAADKRERVDLRAAKRKVFGKRGLTVESPEVVKLA